MKHLISFNNDSQLKDDLLLEVKRHEELDMIVQGHYGRENGKWTGCKVGCSIHSLNKIKGLDYRTDDHSAYESGFGVSRIIARLTDRIFEGLPKERMKTFPFEFWSAVPVGKNLDNVWRKFLIWLLVDPQTGVIKHAADDQQRKAIQDVADLLERSLVEKITPEQFREVHNAARAAAAAYAAAAYAYAYAAAYAAAAARKQRFVTMADKLIELLQAA